MATAKSLGFPEYSPEKYQDIAMNDLVTYSVHLLLELGRVVTEEEIVAACFLIFPQKFSMRVYPEWPNANVVIKRWIDCRSRGYLSGSTAKSFLLTPMGRSLAVRTMKRLSEVPIRKTKNNKYEQKDEERTQEGRLVKSLRNSDAFKKYQLEKSISLVTEFDFRDSMLCTMESSREVLKKNLEQFRHSSKVYRRADLLSFLDLMSTKFLIEPVGPKKKSGGMIKKNI